MRSRELVFGTYVTKLRAGEMATWYLIVDEYSCRYIKDWRGQRGRHSQGLLLFLLLLLLCVGHGAQEDVVIGGAESGSGFSVVLSQLRRRKRKRKVDDFGIEDC